MHGKYSFTQILIYLLDGLRVCFKREKFFCEIYVYCTGNLVYRRS